MIVDCAHYRNGRRQDVGPMEVRRAGQISSEEEGLSGLGCSTPSRRSCAKCRNISDCMSRGRGRAELPPTA